MSPTENKNLIRGVFEQLALGNGRAMTEAMSDDVSWTFPGSWSWSGTWKPKQSVLDDLLEPLFEQFADRYHARAELVLADGDHVVVQVRGQVTTKRGEAYENTYCYIFRIDNGRIAEIIEHCDTALVERVLDPPDVRATAVPPGRA